MPVTVKDLSEESTVAAGLFCKKCKTNRYMYRQTGCFTDKPGRGHPVSQLLTEKQLSHSGMKTRRSRLFTGLQVVQIHVCILAHVMRELSHNPPTTLRELRVHQIWNEIYPRIPWRNYMKV